MRAEDCREDLEVVTVRPRASVMTLQRLPYFVGVRVRRPAPKTYR
jgi:hypothetical protein